MKYTLLDLVQTIASSMDSDEVNSIGDSVESLQIAAIVRTAYFDIVNRAKLPEQYSLITLDASGDATKPTLMTLPSTVSKIDSVSYDKREDASDPILMTAVPFMDLPTFLERMYTLSTDEDNVGSFDHTIDTDTFTILYVNDRGPCYYTSFDDNTLIFDSYDADVDTTLQKSKTVCRALKITPFTLTDSFDFPELDDPQFALLLNEAKSLAWAELKQTVHGIAERNSRRGWSNLNKNKFATEHTSDFNALPNFGRK